MRFKIERSIEEMVLAGRGVGIGDGYQPWLMPHKRVTSTSSNISYVPMPMLRRHCYFLSRGEKDLSHILWWVGAEDVREQFPLWPWAHPNPLAEIDPTTEWPPHPGMDAVAEEAQIRTYWHPRFQADHVLTLDLMVTYRSDEDAKARLLGISCKPLEQYIEADLSSRLRERLELDRRYCCVAEINYQLIHPEFIPATLVRQVEWLAPLQPRKSIHRLVASCAYPTFVERLSTTAFLMPASDAVGLASRGLDWPPATAQFAAHLAMWRLDVDVDLREPISMASPLPKGGRPYREFIRSRLFGET